MVTVGATPAVPLLFGVCDFDGTGEGVMIAGEVEVLADCPGLGHQAAGALFALHALFVFEGWFGGRQVPGGCAFIGAGDSLALVQSVCGAKWRRRVPRAGRLLAGGTRGLGGWLADGGGVEGLVVQAAAEAQ